MITTGDLKRGIVVEIDGRLLQIVDWDHIKVVADRRRCGCGSRICVTVT